MSTVLEQIASPDSSVLPPWPVRRFTVDEYRAIGATGVLEEHGRVELLEGWIVPKVNHNPPHDWTVTHNHSVFSRYLGDEWVMRIQCAITTDDSAPEPDHVIARGPDRRYLRQHPQGEDIALAIEVADSSLARDRYKAAIYAAANIPVYWIINLVEHQIEVHSNPDAAGREYRQQETLRPGDQLKLSLGEQTILVEVDALLPPQDA